MSKVRTAEDHYVTLGVDRRASIDAIRAAFREHAKVLHPDMNRQRDTTAEFQRVQAAYAVLVDPEQRAQYDEGRLATDTVLPAHPPRPNFHNPDFRPARRSRRRYLFVIIPAAILAVVLYPSDSEERYSTPILAKTSPGGSLELPGLPPDMQAAAYQGAQDYSGAQRSNADVELAGRNGAKVTVSGLVAKELEPLQNKIVANAEVLRTRGDILASQRDHLEKERRTLDPSNSAAVTSFNERVETLNRDSEAFKADCELHTQDVETYFSELDRLALRVRTVADRTPSGK